jgi:UDP-arabinose 4-epimerase
VLHFAARSLVGDSIRQPLHYYEVNVAGTIGLVQEMLAAGVRNLVFSSTCAIYGDPRWLPLDESHPWTPVSPYGHSKAMVEQVLADCRAHEGLRVTTLRYFNAAGALPDGSLGESHRVESHLIPLALDAALGKRPPLQLYGTDYPTRDGTGVRDYIHVLDLAVAHRLALQRLLDGDVGTAYNVGTGQGTTVREVLAAVERAVGHPVPCLEGPRRPGDPPALYAQARRIQEDLGWRARWTSIDDIVATAARWCLHRRF